MLKQNFRVHFIHDKWPLQIRELPALPRVGDEIRFGKKLFATVHLVVWSMDEETHCCQRVNIGIESPQDFQNRQRKSVAGSGEQKNNRTRKKKDQ